MFWFFNTNKHRALNSFIYVLLSVYAFSQDKTALDSLTQQKENASLPVRIKALNELCRIYTGIDNSKAMHFSALAIQNSLRSKNELLIAQSKTRLGTIYEYRGVLDSATFNYLAALKIFESFKDKSGIASVYQNMGVMYYFQNDLDKAIDYYSKAIKLRTQTNELEYVAKLQNNIAVILRRQEKYDEAIDYYKKALAIKSKLNDQEAIAVSYANMGTAYLYLKDFNNAKLFLKKALDINSKLNSNINLAGNYFTLGEINFNEKKYDAARLNVTTSMHFATTAESNDILYNACELLWQIDTAVGDYKAAVLRIHEGMVYKAKVFKKEKAEAIEKLNVLYETEKKDKEIVTLNAEQNKERTQRKFLLFGFGLTLIILIITTVYFKKVKSKNELLSFQKREIEDKTHLLNLQATEIAKHRTQMNPHFIFNALVTVQKFILKENKFNAAHYLTMLSKLMRLTLYNSEKEYISLKEEKEFLDFYIEFERSRFENSFTYSFLPDETIDENNTLVPPMILQPFIENAIKHGLSPKNTGGTIEIFIRRITDQHTKAHLLFEVKDNGVGRETAKKQAIPDEDHRSKGLDITVSRIRTTCRTNNLDERECVEIIDLKDIKNACTGTLVKIKLPLIENF